MVIVLLLAIPTADGRQHRPSRVLHRFSSGSTGTTFPLSRLASLFIGVNTGRVIAFSVFLSRCTACMWA